MLNSLAAAVAMIVLMAANQALPPADAPPSADTPAPVPNMAIVGGHRIQPRANAGPTAPDAAAINKRDAEDVDRLYQELMRQTAPDATKGLATPQ